jgi:acetyl-CoA C-acetyltransferase
MQTQVVIAGWGQITQRKEQDTGLRDPLGLMAAAARTAADTAGSRELLRQLDGIMVVRPLSVHYPSAAEQLAANIGTAPRYAAVSKIGGNSPQSMVNQAAGMLARGELETVLIAGAEAYYPRPGKPASTGNALFQGLPEDYNGDDTIGSTALEQRHGIAQPLHGFPLFETALWAASGLPRDAYLKKIGELWAPFSAIAARHPHAWSRTRRSATEISTPSAANRFIALPYTKYMNPLVTVDQGAAIIMTTGKKGRRLAGRGKRPVYFCGGGYAEDRQRFLIEKGDFVSSPPLRAAVDKALQRSQISLAEIDCLDLYSCFPCAVAIAKRELGLSTDDPRPLTLTGGLGFFGGPGNNYSLHAIATLAAAIADGEKETGLITSLGWFLHKHAAGIYSARPASTDLSTHDLEDLETRLVGDKPIRIVDRASGKGHIETCTVKFSREGRPETAILYGRTAAGSRFVAQTQPEADTLDLLINENQVGRSVQLRHIDRHRLNIADLI